MTALIWILGNNKLVYMMLSTRTFYIWSGLWGYPATYRVTNKPYKGVYIYSERIHTAVTFSTNVGWQYYIADTVCFFISVKKFIQILHLMEQRMVSENACEIP